LELDFEVFFFFGNETHFFGIIWRGDVVDGRWAEK
jgi:hypothetical protein